MRRLSSKYSQWFLLAGMVVAVWIVALPVLSYPMGRDQGMYANIGKVILHGGTPFVDMWDIKPPPVYYIYAAGIGLFGTSTVAIRLIDFALVPVGMLGLYLTGTLAGNRRTGFFAALLYAVFYFNDGFQNLSQSDSFATVPAIWIAYASLRASQSEPGTKEGLIASLSAGFLSGFLLWFKPQQYALVVSAFVIFHLIQRLKRASDGEIQSLVQESAGFAIGGLISGGSLLLYFWSQGIIQEIFIVAEGTAAYNAQGYDLLAFVSNMRQGLYFRWGVWHGLFILSAVWLILYILRLVRKNGGDDSISGLLILWWVSGLLFAFVQAKGFDTHWFPMLGPMALMGAIALNTLLEPMNHKNGLIAVHSLIVIGLLSIPAITGWGQGWRYLRNQESRYDYLDRFQANDLKPEESYAMANYLRERVQPGDSLYIWGFRPEVYFMADLWSATRYQAQFPLVAPWYPQEWKQNNVDILWAAMPPYALVLEDDFMPHVTDFDADSHTLLQDYTELNNWLIANYERVDQIGDFIIWRRSTR